MCAHGNVCAHGNLHQRFFQAASQRTDYFTQCAESLAQEVLHV